MKESLILKRSSWNFMYLALEKMDPSQPTSASKDECDQNNDFKTQLLIIAGVAVVMGLAMCLAGKLDIVHTQIQGWLHTFSSVLEELERWP
jgi:hypothetical protein